MGFQVTQLPSLWPHLLLSLQGMCMLVCVGVCRQVHSAMV